VGFCCEVYVGVGDLLGDGGWAIRVQVKRFVRWIWLGGLLTGLGGVLGALDRRYRCRVASKVREALGLSGAGL
ncbi:cytochrome c-type biogenesis CcmF C-terminal domain-containing protein, partial [Pseudomonas syringae pv. tagetis]|uniref:cytochrome c-type biogenesis CcmF C-terminal domain-containing protein n=1 Tax=Pseudomonas syringae group genomosp. 7 TaxID=251699 RepID=UPI00376F468D